MNLMKLFKKISNIDDNMGLKVSMKINKIDEQINELNEQVDYKASI